MMLRPMTPWSLVYQIRLTGIKVQASTSYDLPIDPNHRIKHFLIPS